MFDSTIQNADDFDILWPMPILQTSSPWSQFPYISFPQKRWGFVGDWTTTLGSSRSPEKWWDLDVRHCGTRRFSHRVHLRDGLYMFILYVYTRHRNDIKWYWWIRGLFIFIYGIGFTRLAKWAQGPASFTTESAALCCWAFGRAPQCSIGSRCRDKRVAEENLGLGRIQHAFICFFRDNCGGTCINNWQLICLLIWIESSVVRVFYVFSWRRPVSARYASSISIFQRSWRVDSQSRDHWNS